MSSAAYLYSLLETDRIVRRDLPSGSPAATLAPIAATAEFDALFERSQLGATKLVLMKSLKPAQPQKPALVPSSDGRIDSLLLTIPVDSTSGELGAIYDKLFETLPATTSIICLVNTGSKSAVEQMLKKYKRDATASVIEAPDHIGFSVWAQDAYAISKTVDGDTYFIEPLSFLRYADAVIADYVVGATALRSFQVPLYFQGGNILVGDTFWFIGVDYPTNTLRYVKDAIFPNPGETSTDLVRRLFKEHLDFSRDLIYVGSPVAVPEEDVVLAKEGGKYFVDVVFQGNHPGTAQPLFHIDMFLSLAGRDGQKYRVFVGDPSKGPAPPSSLLVASYAMQNVYDAIANALASDGRFTVTRNPLPLTFTEQMIPVSQLNRPDDSKIYAIYGELTKAGQTQVAIRRWYFATANNALVEITSSSKTVWLPTYGHGPYAYLKASDDANAKLWTDLGFAVKLLPSFHRLARGLGAVHCIQKYLERT